MNASTNALPNKHRVAAELYARLNTLPGWREFCVDVAPLARLASTPGWEDEDGKHMEKGAKAIGMAQWGAALTTAGLVTEAVSGAPWPVPGIDPKGFIWLNWRIGTASLQLELHANLTTQTYQWTSTRDGMPREHTSSELRDVIEALRAVMVGSLVTVQA